MLREENKKKELKSIYFANYNKDHSLNANKISLIKMVIHKNQNLDQKPFENDEIDETNVYNQTCVLALNCLG